MAAPALAASFAESAICLGVTGTAGLRPGVSAEPVTAHEIMTLRCMMPPLQVRWIEGSLEVENGDLVTRNLTDPGLPISIFSSHASMLLTRLRQVQPINGCCLAS